MRLLLTAMSALLFVSANAEARMTKAYVKKDGTYVAPSFKTEPNKTRLDNYSTKGNTNPYTGKKGTEPLFKVKK